MKALTALLVFQILTAAAGAAGVGVSSSSCAAPRDYSTAAPRLIDPRADRPARRLYNFLRSHYGARTLTGQTTLYFNELTSLAGKTPAVRAFDLQNYSPRNPWREDWSAWDDGTVQAAIDWHKATGGKGVVSFQWHWFSPSGGGQRASTFYAKETSFDAARAVEPGSPEYEAVLRDLDAIAVQLKRLEKAGVPVLWRPLHEAGGGWFWWGARGAEPALKLYDLVYRRLAVHHKLHNLVWVWSTPEPAWYPGNAKVDIVGYDSYPGPYQYGCRKDVFDGLYAMTGGRKLIALTENGPIPDLDACYSSDARWLYFLSWGDLAAGQNSPAHIRGVFSHPKAASLEDI